MVEFGLLKAAKNVLMLPLHTIFIKKNSRYFFLSPSGLNHFYFLVRFRATDIDFSSIFFLHVLCCAGLATIITPNRNWKQLII